MGNTEPEGMAALLLIMGAGAGMATAFALWLLFGVLRKRAGEATALFGLMPTVFSLWCVFVALAEWFDSPDGPMVLFGLIIALALLTLMAILAGIAWVHRGRYGMGWGKAFLVLMAEAGAAGVLAYVVSVFYYHWAAYVLGSYALANTLFGCFYLTLLVGLPLMEAFRLGRGPRRAQG